MQAQPANAKARLKSLMESKWLVWSLLGFGIILLILNLFSGGDSAPVTNTTEVTPSDNSSLDFWQWVIAAGNSWIVSVVVGAIIIAAIFVVLRYSGISVAVLGRTSITFIGYIVLSVMIIMFNLLPTEIIVYFSGIIMLILGVMALLSLVMLITGWGNKLAWGVLLLGFGILMLNPPKITTTYVTETATTVVNEGLRGIAPKVAPLVPDFIHTAPPQPLSPEEQARRVAVAKQEAEVLAAQQAATAEAERQAELDAARAYDASYMPARVGPCLREFTDEVDCVTVRFSFKTEYERYAPPGHCIMVVGDGITSEPLGNESGWRRYRAEEATIVQFFTATGARCVP